MSERRPLNWPEIKSRYLNGELPVEIAKDFDGLTSKVIRDKAYRDDWGRQKAAIDDSVADLVFDELKQVTSMAMEITKLHLTDYLGRLQDELTGKQLMNPFVSKEYQFHPGLKIAFAEALKGALSNNEQDEQPKDVNVVVNLGGKDA